MSNIDVEYTPVEYEAEAERYLSGDGTEITFTRQLELLFDNEVVHTKLSYTRRPNGGNADMSEQPVPCVRIDGERYLLSDPRIEVARHCIRCVGDEAR